MSLHRHFSLSCYFLLFVFYIEQFSQCSFIVSLHETISIEVCIFLREVYKDNPLCFFLDMLYCIIFSSV